MTERNGTSSNGMIDTRDQLEALAKRITKVLNRPAHEDGLTHVHFIVFDYNEEQPKANVGQLVATPDGRSAFRWPLHKRPVEVEQLATELRAYLIGIKTAKGTFAGHMGFQNFED